MGLVLGIGQRFIQSWKSIDDLSLYSPNRASDSDSHWERPNELPPARRSLRLEVDT